MKKSSPQPTAEQRQLEALQLERGRELRVENARVTTAAFSDAMQARNKLRGIFSVLSGGFAGFGQGTKPGQGPPDPVVSPPVGVAPPPAPIPNGNTSPVFNSSGSPGGGGAGRSPGVRLRRF